MNAFAHFCTLIVQINLSKSETHFLPKSQNHLKCATAEEEKPVVRIAGEATNASYAPFQVLVTTAKKGAKEGFEICGGTIISERYVITASHCVTDPPKNGKEPLNLKTHNVFVVFGQLDVCPARKEVIKNPKGPWKDVILAKKLFVHPDYHKMLAWENDIAIIEV